MRCLHAFIFALALLTNAAIAGAQRTTTVLLVRHAEKAALPAADPPLTAEGQERAKALVDVARDAGVTAVITTQFARTRTTAQPLAEALGLTSEVIEARGGQHAQQVADAVRSKHAGEVVLVVGHSNTVPAIIAALGAKQPAEICDGEYDHLYVVTIPESGSTRVIRARFGAPSPVGVGCAAMK
jgi:broad specificity phosphatase PhoE